jgi:transcriptional regulator with XRE-family HTH domain
VARPIGAAVERIAHTPEESFGTAVTELRTKRGMTQEDLAHALGYHLSYIGQLERGKKSPTLRTMFNIAQLFELPGSKLLALAEKYQAKSRPKNQ